jgi:hypothetical protein
MNQTGITYLRTHHHVQGIYKEKLTGKYSDPNKAVIWNSSLQK